MKRNVMLILFLAAVLLTVGVSSTLAWLVASSQSLENTFTVGAVKITLTESTGDEYIMTPGVTLKKDPAVTVRKSSEPAWVFVKATPTLELENFCTYGIADGWLPLSGYGGVYYRKVPSAPEDQRFPVLKDDLVTVKDSVTEEELFALAENPKLVVLAYAIQAEGVETPEAAWLALNE